MTATQIMALIGGVGLFLLGMGMMTDGLKLAAGSLLRDLLARWTSTRLRGLATGALITAVVQSSSAVTIAVIGFVNAGILSLTRAIWVVFGCNVGTTMTGWLVALIGVNLKVEAFALPAIGIGMIVQLVGHPSSRIAAFGRVLAGFGLFFFGIGLLKDSFTGTAEAIDLSAYADVTFLGSLLFIAVGIVMTTAMQSSSAAIAIALTAASGGLIEIAPAAALVIGANVGTTSTGILAVLNATPSARRVAMAHCAFNLLTGVVAFALLPGLVASVEWLQQTVKLEPDPATTLALFHTVFNLVGIVLLWPISARLVRWLQKRFTSKAEVEARPVYLDETVLSVPDLGLFALQRELGRLDTVSNRLALAAVGEASPAAGALQVDAETIEQLGSIIASFAHKLGRHPLPEGSAVALSHLYRALQHHSELADNALEVGELRAGLTAFPPALAADIAGFSELIQRSIREIGGLPADTDAATPERIYKDSSGPYETVKAEILMAGSAAEIDPAAIDQGVDLIFQMRRCLERTAKARRREVLMRRAMDGAEDTGRRGGAV